MQHFYSERLFLHYCYFRVLEVPRQAAQKVKDRVFSPPRKYQSVFH